MKLKKLFIIVLLIIFFVPSSVYSQEKPKISKKDFNITDVGFKEAWKGFKKGKKLFKQNKKGSYNQAIEFLLVAYEYNPDYAPLNYELGVSYLKISDEKQGLEFIEEAFNLNAFVTKDIHFWLARAYHLNNEFDDAIDEYKIYRDALSEKILKKNQYRLNKYIEECNNGKKLVQNPIKILIDNLGEGINTKFPEYSPIYAPYDSVVFFTSRRDITVKEKSNKRNRILTNDYYEDVYFTSYKTGRWHEAKIFPKPINKRRSNEASVAVDPHGEQLLVYRGNKGSGGIYITEYNLDNEKWKRPKKVIRKISKGKYRETTLTFTHDSLTVYFISNNKKGVGGKDIWYSRRRGNSNSGWTKPKNMNEMGTNINTEYNEEAVFLTKNDSILYFCSQGHNSMGGYDFFRTYQLPDKTWSEPENVGYPLNTADDDMFIFVNEGQRTGYFASNGQEDCYGEFDLYEYFFYSEKELFQDDEDDLIAYIKRPVNELSLEDPVKITTMQLTVIKGTVSEYETLKPLEATIEITNNKTQKIVQNIKTNATTGQYMVMLPSGFDYGMAVSCPGYMFHSENFNVPAANGYQEIIKDIQLLPIDPGSKIVLNNVFFDTGKHFLRPESFPELNRLAQAFTLYPNLVIEISGHTDSRGSNSANQALSQRRAQAVVDYLISIGVAQTNVVAKGYGEDQPRATNKTKEGRQLNRRVEAKIISN